MKLEWQKSEAGVYASRQMKKGTDYPLFIIRKHESESWAIYTRTRNDYKLWSPKKEPEHYNKGETPAYKIPNFKPNQNSFRTLRGAKATVEYCIK